jgi:Kef-type K+ transport system membrane component KefB
MRRLDRYAGYVMHSVPLLVNIALALGYALLGGLVARRLGLPTIVGYLLAGVALGPLRRGSPATWKPSSNWPSLA